MATPRTDYAALEARLLRAECALTALGVLTFGAPAGWTPEGQREGRLAFNELSAEVLPAGEFVPASQPPARDYTPVTTRTMRKVMSR